MVATRETHAERLRIVRETVSSLYNRVKENIEYGRERLKDTWEKEAMKEREENEQGGC